MKKKVLARQELSQRAERCTALERDLQRVTDDLSAELRVERERRSTAERGRDAAAETATADAERMASVHAEEVEQVRAAAAAQLEEAIAAKERALEQVCCCLY